MPAPATTQRDALLSEADALLHKPGFTKEDSSRVESLLQLADRCGERGMQLRKARLAQHEAAAGMRTQRSESLLGIDEEFRAYLFGGKKAIFPIEKRAQSITVDSSGGYLVPQPFRRVLEESLKEYDQIFDVATRIESATGNATNIPIADDTSQQATQIAENQLSVTSNVDVNFAAIAFSKTPTWRTGLIRGSREWVEDSAIDVEESLAHLFALRIARGVGSAFTTSLLSAATVGVNAAASTTITGDEVLSLMASLDPAYAQRGAFLMNFTTLLSLWKLKASTGGQYLIPTSVDDEGYPTIFTRRCYLSPSMPNMTTGQLAVAFGDLSRFIRRDVVNSWSLRTYEERYAEFLQLAWEMFLRVDGALLIPTVPSGSPATILSPVRTIKMA
jgi:HK97 family phage major capsid protein